MQLGTLIEIKGYPLLEEQEILYAFCIQGEEPFFNLINGCMIKLISVPDHSNFTNFKDFIGKVLTFHHWTDFGLQIDFGNFSASKRLLKGCIFEIV